MQDQATGHRGARRVCQECGREFIARSDCATRVSKFCSRECGWAVQKRQAADAIPPREELERRLREAGSTTALGRAYGRSAWWAKAALAARGIPEIPHKKTVLIACEVCGQRFEAKRSQVRRGRRFCSRECMGAGMPAPSSSDAARQKIANGKRGARNPMWKGEDTEGSVYRVFNVRLKGEKRCRNCGHSDGVLHLHHIVPRSMCKAGVRDMRNGVTLCLWCHSGWHQRRVTIHREILTAEEWAFVSSLELLGQSITAWLDDRYPPRGAPERTAA